MAKADLLRLADHVQNETGCGLVAGVASVMAVLRAMREPTSAMIDAGDGTWKTSLQATYPDSEGSFTEDGVAIVWRAMIDNLLEE